MALFIVCFSAHAYVVHATHASKTLKQLTSCEIRELCRLNTIDM